jgi:hypothetical protein
MSADPIAADLSELRAGLLTPAGRSAEIIAEAEDHLRESAAAFVASGLPEPEVARAAIEAFGPVKRVTRAHRPSAPEYAAAYARRARPLLAGYLLAFALLGAGWLAFSVYANWGLGQLPLWATAAVAALAGASLLAWSVIVRRRHRRAGTGPARLPRGLSLLADAVSIAAAAAAEWHFFMGDVNQRLDLPEPLGLCLVVSQQAVVLTGALCVLWTLARLGRWGVDSLWSDAKARVRS